MDDTERDPFGFPTAGAIVTGCPDGSITVEYSCGAKAQAKANDAVLWTLPALRKTARKA
jgi:hypothetical protein